MEGIRRISILIDDEEIFRIRTPFSYVELRRALEKLNISVGKIIEARYQKTKVSISDDKSYFNWLEKSSFKELSINFNTPAVKGSNYKVKIEDSVHPSSSSEDNQPGAKAKSKFRTPKKSENKGKHLKSPRKDEKLKKKSASENENKEKLNSGKKKVKVEDSTLSNRSSEERKKDKRIRSRSRTPQKLEKIRTPVRSSRKTEKTKGGSDGNKRKSPVGKTKVKTEETSHSNSSPEENKKATKNRSRSRTPRSATRSPKTPTKSPNAGSKAANSPSKSPKTPPKLPKNSNSPIKASITPPANTKSPTNFLSTNSSPSKAIPSPPPSSTSPSKPLLFSSTATNHSLFGPSAGISLVQPDVEILKAFAIVQDEGKLKVIDSETNKSRIISEFSIKKSSRLLLTPDGILITGGSGAPYQAMMVKSDYSVVPLVSMNNPRFWHCVGYIDGYPAVANGAERSKVPKVFLNTVEVYKDGYWVNYPSTNISRASACMSWDDKSVYIIGGVVTSGTVNTVVNQIEKFEDSKWVILPVTIPQPLLSCGSVPIAPNNLLIFGGEKSGGALTTTYFSLNLSDDTKIDNEPLKFFTKFTYGQQAKVQNNSLTCCDFQGRILKLEINKILS